MPPWIPTLACPDGSSSLMQPADYLILLISPPQQHPNASSEYGCVNPTRYTLDTLHSVLPRPTKQFSPEDLVDSIITLFISSVALMLLMIATKLIWSAVDSRFAAINPPHKQWYVVANCWKAVLLLTLAVSPNYWWATWDLLTNQMEMGDIEITKMKRCGLIYVVTDIVALYMVPKLPKTTILHHVATCAIYLIIGGLNMHQNSSEWHGAYGLCKTGVLYAFFSCFTYGVNAYLGLRVIYSSASWMSRLVRFSLAIYVISCAANWSIQLYWLVHALLTYPVSLFMVVRSVLLALVIRDDIILMSWLNDRAGFPRKKSS